MNGYATDDRAKDPNSDPMDHDGAPDDDSDPVVHEIPVFIANLCKTIYTSFRYV